MKDAEEYFDSLLSTDANCPVDVYAHKYNRADLFRFAEAYHKERVNAITDADIEEWAEKHAAFIGFDNKPNINIAKQVSFIAGAKAMRYGEIKIKM